MDFNALFKFDLTFLVGPVSLDGGEPSEELFEEDATFETGEVDAEAEVLGDAEAQVRVGSPEDVEGLGVGEHGFVPIGRGVHHGDLVAGRDRLVADHGVGARCPSEVVQRVVPPQDLLDRAGDERRIAAYRGKLFRVVEQSEEPARQHGLGGVVARGDELDEEDAEVEVGHRLAVEVGHQQDGGEVFARRFRSSALGVLDRVDGHVGHRVPVVAAAAATEVGVLRTGEALGHDVDSGPIPFR